MAIIKDLSQLAKEPLILKFSEETQYTIPLEPSVDLTFKIADFQDKVENAKTNKEQIDLFVEIVTTILQQDQSHKVNTSFVKKNLSFSQMQAVVQTYVDQISKNNSNPN